MNNLKHHTHTDLQIDPRRPGHFGAVRLGASAGLASLLILSLGMTACTDKKTPPAPVDVPLTSGPVIEPTTNVQGVVPAGPTQEAATTKSQAKSDVTKEQQSSAMPMPGQANDHSVLLPKPVQAPASR